MLNTIYSILEAKRVKIQRAKLVLSRNYNIVSASTTT